MRILVLEQDTSIQKVVTIALAGLGYQVETANDIDEAIFSMNLCWPDVFIMNFVLSGGTGDVVLNKVRSLFGEIPPTVIFSSLPIDFIQRRELPKIVFLQAPYTVEELQRSIYRASALQELELMETPRVGYC